MFVQKKQFIFLMNPKLFIKFLYKLKNHLKRKLRTKLRFFFQENFKVIGTHSIKCSLKKCLKIMEKVLKMAEQ